MDSLSVSDIKRLLEQFPLEGETGRIVRKFPSVGMKQVMSTLADWIAAINLHDFYADRTEDYDHLPFFWITGEEGVGKRELVLRIHELVDRKDLVELLCESLDGDRIRSELFGHANGVSLEDGEFWKAKEGLLIIYRPPKLPTDCQDYLLRWHKLRPIREPGGDRQVEYLDPVIIFVDHASLEEIMSAGAMLPGLATKMLPHIQIPPLRERPEDVVILIENLFRTKGQEFRDRELSVVQDLEEEALFVLVNFHWPRNISALREVITKLVFPAPRSNHEHQITFPMVVESLEDFYGDVILDILAPLCRRNRRSQKRKRVKRDDVWLDELRVLRRLIDIGYPETDLAKALGISPFTLSREFAYARRLEDARIAPIPKGRRKLVPQQ